MGVTQAGAGAVKAVGAIVDDVALKLGADVGAQLDLGEVNALGFEVFAQAADDEAGVGC